MIKVITTVPSIYQTDNGGIKIFIRNGKKKNRIGNRKYNQDTLEIFSQSFLKREDKMIENKISIEDTAKHSEI